MECGEQRDLAHPRVRGMGSGNGSVTSASLPTLVPVAAAR
jgi:hypothetical protein